ncbi:hypothetical protein HPB47_016848 [Ixodes persulcatus]|uniref:Uncharacterized protein n=1 Tax=Ixodes persulcatus TaxID=34615 RepID=A0AC60QTK0_IXOPE|nr:hypothetical protein HPB47_016848 [Ixodes persulcatus]
MIWKLQSDRRRINDLSVTTLLGVVIVYYSEKAGKVVSTFLSLVELTDSKALFIVDAVKICIAQFRIDLQRTVGIGTNNASVMVGVNNGSVSELKAEVPNLLLEPCKKRSNLEPELDGGRGRRRPGLRGGGNGDPLGGGAPTAVALIPARGQHGVWEHPVSGSLPPGHHLAPPVRRVQRSPRDPEQPRSAAPSPQGGARRHPSADSRRDGRHGVRSNPGQRLPPEPPRGHRHSPPWKPVSWGWGGPLPATKSTRHVATWTWQQGTGPPHGFVSWRGWSEQRRPRPGSRATSCPALSGPHGPGRDREAQGASMTPDPAAVYCEAAGSSVSTRSTTSANPSEPGPGARGGPPACPA